MVLVPPNAAAARPPPSADHNRRHRPPPLDPSLEARLRRQRAREYGRGVRHALDSRHKRHSSRREQQLAAQRERWEEERAARLARLAEKQHLVAARQRSTTPRPAPTTQPHRRPDVLAVNAAPLTVLHGNVQPGMPHCDAAAAAPDPLAALLAELLAGEGPGDPFSIINLFVEEQLQLQQQQAIAARQRRPPSKAHLAVGPAAPADCSADSSPALQLGAMHAAAPQAAPPWQPLAACNVPADAENIPANVRHRRTASLMPQEFEAGAVGAAPALVPAAQRSARRQVVAADAEQRTGHISAATAPSVHRLALWQATAPAPPPSDSASQAADKSLLEVPDEHGSCKRLYVQQWLHALSAALATAGPLSAGSSSNFADPYHGLANSATASVGQHSGASSLADTVQPRSPAAAVQHDGGSLAATAQDEQRWVASQGLDFPAAVPVSSLPPSHTASAASGSSRARSAAATRQRVGAPPPAEGSSQQLGGSSTASNSPDCGSAGLQQPGQPGGLPQTAAVMESPPASSKEEAAVAVRDWQKEPALEAGAVPFDASSSGSSHGGSSAAHPGAAHEATARAVVVGRATAAAALPGPPLRAVPAGGVPTIGAASMAAYSTESDFDSDFDSDAEISFGGQYSRPGSPRDGPTAVVDGSAAAGSPAADPEQQEQSRRPRSPLHGFDDRYPGSPPASPSRFAARSPPPGDSRPASPLSQPGSRPLSPAAAGWGPARDEQAGKAAPGSPSGTPTGSSGSTPNSARPDPADSTAPGVREAGEEAGVSSPQRGHGRERQAGSPPSAPAPTQPQGPAAAPCPGSARVDDCTVVQTEDHVAAYLSEVLAYFWEQRAEGFAAGRMPPLDLAGYLALERRRPTCADPQHIFNKLLFDAANEALAAHYEQALGSYTGRLAPRLALLNRERLEENVVRRVQRWAALGGGGAAAAGDASGLLAEDAAEEEHLLRRLTSAMAADLAADLAAEPEAAAQQGPGA